MEVDAPQRPSDEIDMATTTSVFSVAPSSPSQSRHVLNRSAGTATDTGASTFSVSPSPLSSPISSILHPSIHRAATPPPTVSTDTHSRLQSALRTLAKPQEPKISQRVSIEYPHDNPSAASSNVNPFVTNDSRSHRNPFTISNRMNSFHLRDSMLSKMSSNVGNFRDSFLGVLGKSLPGIDPLEISPHQEFNLAVIDETGGLDETIGQILKPPINFRNWSNEGYSVLFFGLFFVLLLFSLTQSTEKLQGYSIDPGLVFGSLVTLVLCTCVFVTYHGVQSFQKHPNPLIYYKCVIDMLVALRFLLDPVFLDLGMYRRNDSNSCAYLSGMTQFLFLSSDCWYFAQIVDLYWSLTNPFMSVQANRKTFKLLIYSAGTFTGFITLTIPTIHGLADGNFCWTRQKTSIKVMERNFFQLNRGSWLLFYSWMLLFYLSGIAVLFFGIKRLRSGLRDTLQSRREMLRNGALSITSYTIYWTIVFFWYALSFQTRDTYDKNGKFPPSHVFRAYSFTLSARGAVDYLVWFTINRPSQIRPCWLQFTTDSADKEFSAQLNTALQEELIYFTIDGMTRAIQSAEDEFLQASTRSRTQRLVSSDDERNDKFSHQDTTTRATVAKSTSSLFQTVQRNRMLSTITEAISAGLYRPNSVDVDTKRATKEAEKSFQIPDNHSNQQQSHTSLETPLTTASPSSLIRFTPYKPHAFAELRQAFDIHATAFRSSFETSTKPKISEGASGAFMFLSGDKKYIVKSLAENEARFLCEIATTYVAYLIAHPQSFITKFYGCFKITMYDRRFYFIVMENLFDVMEVGVQIHHRFDIKGSWVNRSYKRPRQGAKVKCRHCSMMFQYNRTKNTPCPNVVGLHEPNVVLKDNDLRTRMRIGREEGVVLYEQLRHDSLFLCQLGSMDYSLLLGVVDIEFLVDPPSLVDSHGTTSRSSHTVLDTLSNDSFVSKPSTTESTESSSCAPVVATSTSPRVHSFGYESATDLNTSRFVSSCLNAPQPKHSMRKSRRVFGPGYYYVGVIDILQTWTLQKRMERFWKVTVQQKDGNGLSAMDPIRYQRRFEAKLREIISIPKQYFRTEPRVGMAASVQRLSPVLQAAAAFEAAMETRRDEARNRNDSSTSGVSSTVVDGGDLEQAGRNPEPILLPFNQRLISTNSMPSQRSLTDYTV
ncbi:hypothetical protein CCR75_000862 [Bremia lactucae]|uniref:Uncharacterized protein n=1 Tax=Bremia lactucae TaxID=4779 RepID=A0A976IFP8_BRELC|nr:hypothetical protein CCR75_000862 [Bremia lactucae]